MSKCLQYNTNSNPFDSLANAINNRANYATKYQVYVNELNRSMDVHSIYRTNTFIPDYLRISFSRIRLISHSLKVETGRWSRIPHERRVCHCDNTQIQTEAHVLISCPLTQNIRHNYLMLNFTDISTLLSEDSHIYHLCTYIHQVLCLYT